MANEADYRPCSYKGNGSTCDFSYTWKVMSLDELIVQLELISTGELTTLVRGTDYTAIKNDVGGSVTLSTAPSSSYNIIISRNTSDYQSKGYSTSTGFQGSEIENSFDKVSCCLQDMKYGIEVFENEITKTVDDYKDDTDSTIEAYKSATETAISNFETSVSSEISTFKSGVNSEIQTFENGVSSEISTFESSVNSSIETIDGKASSAVSTANAASSNASTALSNSQSAVSTANSASSNASTALSNSQSAVSTANSASSNASTALTNSQSAVETATAASNKVDEFGETISIVIDAAEQIETLQEAIEQATEDAQAAQQAAQDAMDAAAHFEVDDHLDENSENSLQNKVIVEALNGKQATISDLATIRTGAALGATSIQNITSGMIISALGYTPYSAANPNQYISGITSGMIINALEYTPYNAANPNGYVTNSIQTLQQINSTSASITLTDSNSLYKIAPSADVTLTFTNSTAASSTQAYTFELCIDMSTVHAITFPSSVSWQDAETPDLSETGIYFFAFRTIDGGSTWLGNLQGRW